MSDDSIDGRDLHYGRTALHYAGLRDVSLVRLLLDRGADPLIKDNENRTPADAAWERGKRESAEALREAMGPQPPARRRRTESPG